MLYAPQAGSIKLDDGETGPRIYLPEPETLSSPGVEGVRFVLVEVVVVAEGDVVEASSSIPGCRFASPISCWRASRPGTNPCVTSMFTSASRAGVTVPKTAP